MTRKRTWTNRFAGHAVVLACTLVVTSLAVHAQTQPPVQPIATLDVPRYMGTWFEIAKFPNLFQRRCVSDTRAVYTLQADNSVQVLNRCRTADGSSIEALGRAQQVGPGTSPILKVRFAPGWLSWLPLVWGDYWVIDLDADYQLAAVSDARREYLWILSRGTHVAPEVYNALVRRLQAQGFDTTQLQPTTHSHTP